MKIFVAIFFVLFGAGLTWLFFEEYFYSPKACIKRLWREVLEISRMTGEMRKLEDTSGFHGLGIEKLEKLSNVRGNLINALLDYHFPNTEEDQEVEQYVKEHRYEIKK